MLREYAADWHMRLERAPDHNKKPCAGPGNRPQRRRPATRLAGRVPDTRASLTEASIWNVDLRSVWAVVLAGVAIAFLIEWRTVGSRDRASTV